MSWGLVLQFTLRLFVIRTEPGFIAFQWLGDQIQVCTWGAVAQGVLGFQGMEEKPLCWREVGCEDIERDRDQDGGCVWGPDQLGSWGLSIAAATSLRPGATCPDRAVLSEAGSDVEENLKTGRFLVGKPTRHVALSGHNKRNL